MILPPLIFKAKILQVTLLKVFQGLQGEHSIYLSAVADLFFLLSGYLFLPVVPVCFLPEEA